MKKVNKFLRQCISCRTYKQKSELIRITKDYKSNEILVNNNLSINGRSVYICKNIKCIENAVKKRRIENILKSNLAETLKEELSTVLKN